MGYNDIVVDYGSVRRSTQEWKSQCQWEKRELISRKG